jgi:hypothetical protein
VASSTTDILLTATNTVAATTSPSILPIGGASLSGSILGDQVESAFRLHERRDVGGARMRTQPRTTASLSRSLVRGQLAGVPTNPAIGSIVQLNTNLGGNTCSDPAILHAVRVVSIGTHSIVMIDTLSPAGGYTDAELAAFGVMFDTLGFALDTTNFGAPTDIDGNGRVAILFTPGINRIPAPVGAVVGGLFAARDLFQATATGCTASNVGEMFYMPVPDPNRTINANYTNKTMLSTLVAPTLVHEFQHLINAGRRLYVNNAADFEEVWLNEGLSHIAEELLYYRTSGNAPLQNIDATLVRSSQAQVNAFNADQGANFGRLSAYLKATAANSPFALVDGLEMRGAIWQLLRYAADQKGGNQQLTWRSLVNSVTNGQANFNAVFGDIITSTRNWAIAQFVDDTGLAVGMQYTNPSWNYRSIFGAIGTGVFPLATNPLVDGNNVQISVVGGGAAYVRFGVAANTTATVAATSSNQAVPPNVDFILVRTR